MKECIACRTAQGCTLCAPTACTPRQPQRTGRSVLWWDMAGEVPRLQHATAYRRHSIGHCTDISGIAGMARTWDDRERECRRTTAGCSWTLEAAAAEGAKLMQVDRQQTSVSESPETG